MNETQLENLCLDWFAENGWEVVHGVDIAPDSNNSLRKDYKQIFSVHDKFHRILVLSGFFFLKIASTFLNSSFFPKPIKRRIAI